MLKYTDQLDPTLMHLAFVFILIGFVPKRFIPQCMHGYPMRTVKHQAQSVLLSAVLLICTLIIIRYYIIIDAAIGTEFT